MNLLDRITVNPRQCGGRPCIRGLRIRVADVLDLLASGRTAAQIVEELPDLETDDVRASVAYARRRLDHPVLVTQYGRVNFEPGRNAGRCVLAKHAP